MKRSTFLKLALTVALSTFGTAVYAADTAPAAGPAAPAPLAVGSTAPNFTLPSQEKNLSVSLSAYKGKWVVLYFYPKDMSKGCTIEAHNFQRDQDKYTALNAAILGVSMDTADSHQAFCTKENLTFKLLADPDHKVVDLYGVPVVERKDPATGAVTMSYAARWTYLINPKGKIVQAWTKVDVNGHSDEVLAALAAAK
jgi:thioredoxin-dependent peroxiredoxin